MTECPHTASSRDGLENTLPAVYGFNSSLLLAVYGFNTPLEMLLIIGHILVLPNLMGVKKAESLTRSFVILSDGYLLGIGVALICVITNHVWSLHQYHQGCQKIDKTLTRPFVIFVSAIDRITMFDAGLQKCQLGVAWSDMEWLKFVLAVRYMLNKIFCILHYGFYPTLKSLSK